MKAWRGVQERAEHHGELGGKGRNIMQKRVKNRDVQVRFFPAQGLCCKALCLPYPSLQESLHHFNERMRSREDYLGKIQRDSEFFAQVGAGLKTEMTDFRGKE